MLQVTDGPTVKRTDSRTEGSRLQIQLFAALRQDRMMSFALFSTFMHDAPYVLQYDYPRRALSSVVW